MDAQHKTHIDALLKKAAESSDAAQAVNFAQAACNSANAVRVLKDIDKGKRT